jgi:hypothetical protein
MLSALLLGGAWLYWRLPLGGAAIGAVLIAGVAYGLLLITTHVMVHGTLLQIVSGLVLLGIVEAAAAAGGDPVDHAKFGVKILLAVVIMFLAWPRRKDAAIPAGTYHAVGLLALANVAIAVFWK